MAIKVKKKSATKINNHLEKFGSTVNVEYNPRMEDHPR